MRILSRRYPFIHFPPTLGDCEQAVLHCCSSRCRGRSDSECVDHRLQSTSLLYSTSGRGDETGPRGVFSVCLQLSEHNFYLLSTVENVFTWSQLISKFLISKHNLVSNRCFFFMCPRVNHIFLSFTVVVVKLFTMKSKNRLTSRTCLCHVSHLCL